MRLLYFSGNNPTDEGVFLLVFGHAGTGYRIFYGKPEIITEFQLKFICIQVTPKMIRIVFVTVGIFLGSELKKNPLILFHAITKRR